MVGAIPLRMKITHVHLADGRIIPVRNVRPPEPGEYFIDAVGMTYKQGAGVLPPATPSRIVLNVNDLPSEDEARSDLVRSVKRKARRDVRKEFSRKLRGFLRDIECDGDDC
jgi:hypothetical protein